MNSYGPTFRYNFGLFSVLENSEVVTIYVSGAKSFEKHVIDFALLLGTDHRNSKNSLVCFKILKTKILFAKCLICFLWFFISEADCVRICFVQFSHIFNIFYKKWWHKCIWCESFVDQINIKPTSFPCVDWTLSKINCRSYWRF